MASRLLSLENISVVKSTILICLSPQLKREILCVPGSEYDICKPRYQYYRKEHWNAIVENKAKEIMQHRQVPKCLENKVLNLLPAIALRMLIWAEYHEGLLGLSRYYSLDFLRFSHFTWQGVIDRKKAAEDMIKDANLNIKQKYKLACIYCFTCDITFFYKQIVGDKEDTDSGPKISKWMENPEIVKFWTSQMKGECNDYNLRNFKCLQAAIKTSSTEAVKYSLEMAGNLRQEFFHIDTAIETLMFKSEKCDWIVFRDTRFDDREDYWVPIDYSVDVLCIFLSNITHHGEAALRMNVTNYGLDPSRTDYKTVLEFFLSWPYQDYFMKTIALLWNSLPRKTYAAILLKICDKIDPCKKENLLYGEERSYDYKQLLKDFWCRSPDHFKKYVFKNKPIAYTNGVRVVTTTGIGLLLKLLSLKKFTYEDEEMIWLILGSASDEKKANLTSAEWWSSTCISVLKKEKFEIFDRLLLLFCKSEENIIKFQKKLYEEALDICLYLLRNGKLHAVKSLINRISSSEVQLRDLKKNIIYSQHAIQLCRKFLLSRRCKDFEEFVKWFLPQKEAEISFKRFLSSQLKENLPVHQFRSTDASDFITGFTRSLVLNKEVIGQLQTGIADIFGRAICKELIAASSFQVAYQENDSSLKVEIEFRGGQWEKVDNFLTCCLSTEKEILEFKKTFYKSAGVDIHFKLIVAKQWKEAKRFFDWLGLSESKIKDLKERTFFHHNECWQMFRKLVFEHDDEMHNLETIDLLLRWHLTDKVSVITYRDAFLDYHMDYDYDEVALKQLNSLIEDYLDDLDQEEIFSNL